MDSEDNDQHQRHPEVDHGNTPQREDVDESVQEGLRAERGRGAEEDAERRGQQKGCRGQAESGGQTVQHQAQGRCLLPEGVSEIQENRARRESGILHRDRIVQAQLVAHLLDAFFRGFDAHHDTNGVTYHTARDEDECENSECDANRVDGASEKIGKNWTGLYCGGARRGKRGSGSCSLLAPLLVGTEIISSPNAAYHVLRSHCFCRTWRNT